MKRLARTVGGEPLLGDEMGFVPLSAADPSLRSVEDALAMASLPDPESAAAERVADEGIAFGPPIERSPQLWGIGLNYIEHAADLDETRPTAPASFLQPPGVLRGPGGPIHLPPETVTSSPTAEAELGVVIGRTCRDVKSTNASQVIAGFVPVIDVTAEDQIRENPRFLTRSKQYDSFLVLGASIVCADQDDGDRLDDWTIRTVREGETIAENRVGNARFSPAEIVASLSTSTTIEGGTIIATGTPGAVPIAPGDTVRAEIDPIGSVEARVTA